jgi:hypothetical protein
LNDFWIADGVLYSAGLVDGIDSITMAQEKFMKIHKHIPLAGAVKEDCP